jgi:hypothetical protein
MDSTGMARWLVGRSITTHSTERAISLPLIENLSVAAVRARRLIRALGSNKVK